MKSILPKLLVVLYSVACFFSANNAQRTCCQPGQSCWPTQQEIDDITNALDPTFARTYWWNGVGTPYPGAVGEHTPDSVKNQPLYGFGKSLNGFYVNTNASSQFICFVNGYVDDFCMASMRNNPMETWQPAFVAFPVNSAQVSLLVNFARNHNLCVCALGTGHDFQNRHSCNNGLLIRGSLLKGKQFNADTNTITFGSGITFSEAHAFAEQNNRMLASGWSPTVGIAGWTLGGGHGPYNPKHGLGADNLVAAEIVTSDGNIITATKTTNTDLLKALRGGGGSTWGILTSMTLQSHDLPTGGFVRATLYLPGDFCNDEKLLHSLIESYLNWTVTLDSNWGGLNLIIPNLNGTKSHNNYFDTNDNNDNKENGPCDSWIIYIQYHYQGSQTDQNFVENWQKLVSEFPARTLNVIVPYPTPWSIFSQLPPETIRPYAYMTPFEPFYDGSAPSVMIPTDQISNGNAVNLIIDFYTGCAIRTCGALQIFQDVTGNIGSPQDPFTSVNPGMRSALFHVIFAVDSAKFYTLGDYSYFGESAYKMDNWQHRLWGDSYDTLLQTKKKYDPIGLFTCRHCVGDTSD